MKSPLILRADQLVKILNECVNNQIQGSISFLAKGQWRMAKVNFCSAENKTLHLEIITTQPSVLNFVVDQPVGISFQYDDSKCIFETTVVGSKVSSQDVGNPGLIVSMPDRMEKIPRRIYGRAVVPDDLNVKVFFWHKGYRNENTSEQGSGENCWQGQMIDLSGGGMQISIDPKRAEEFKKGQIVGMQFTPLAYQQPICVEGEVKHIADVPNEKMVYLGVQFTGLEATHQGRKKLRRIISTVNSYLETSGQEAKEPLFESSVMQTA